jgi:hypothetical protein
VTDRPAAEQGRAPRPRRLTSLTRRLIGVAAIWITVLLLGGGYALDRVLTSSLVENFDKQLEYVLNAMIAASALFGGLFPGFRRRRGYISFAFPLGPPAARRQPPQRRRSRHLRQHRIPK